MDGAGGYVGHDGRHSMKGGWSGGRRGSTGVVRARLSCQREKPENGRASVGRGQTAGMVKMVEPETTRPSIVAATV